jgi:hypothetical protein
MPGVLCVCSERDHLERDHMDASRQLAVLEGAHSNVQKERDDLVREVGILRWLRLRWCGVQKMHFAVYITTD